MYLYKAIRNLKSHEPIENLGKPTPWHNKILHAMNDNG